jgi:Uma2 family endonuclease
MSADEYFRLVDDGYRYELIEGVVCMSPSPTPKHQKLIVLIATQIETFLESQPIGHVFVEVDVDLGPGTEGKDLVYRPDVVFTRAVPAAPIPDRIVGGADLVVEIISDTSRRYDSETKKADYERAGVAEYWLIDPERSAMTFFQLVDGRFVEMTPDGDKLLSKAVDGFTLDLARIRRAFRGA